MHLGYLFRCVWVRVYTRLYSLSVSETSWSIFRMVPARHCTVPLYTVPKSHPGGHSSCFSACEHMSYLLPQPQHARYNCAQILLSSVGPVRFGSSCFRVPFRFLVVSCTAPASIFALKSPFSSACCANNLYLVTSIYKHGLTIPKTHTHNPKYNQASSTEYP